MGINRYVRTVSFQLELVKFKLVTKKSFEKSVRISSSKMNDIVTKESWQRFELIIFLEHTQTAVGQND